MSLAISIKKQVKGRCEYCRINEKFSPYSHEIDHIIPHKHAGLFQSKIFKSLKPLFNKAFRLFLGLFCRKIFNPKIN